MDSCPGEPDPAADDDQQYPEATRSLDSLREMRLTALLGDLVDEKGKAQAAETLGVSQRTLTRFEESGRLTRTLAAALEKHLALGGGTAAAQQRQRAAALEDGLAELAQALRRGLAAVRRERKAAHDEQAGELAALERRVAALESAAASAGNTQSTGGGGSGSGAKAPVARPGTAGTPPDRPRRDHYDLVTAEAEPGEELVYGEAATAVILRWREARDDANRAKDALVKLNAREQRLELEIALIEEHQLTLPPATYPWDWGDRRQEVGRRNDLLYDIKVDRFKLKLRRCLTLGLWWN